MEIVVVLAVVAVVGLLIWAGVLDRKHTVSRLRSLAERHGLQLQGADSLFSSLSLVGRKEGRSLRFWTFSTGSGKSRQSWVAVGLEVRPLGEFTFDLRPQGVLTKLSALFGAREAVIGDPAFDQRWFLRTNNPDALAAALVPEIRERLDEAYAAGARGYFRTEQGWVCYAETGTFSSDAKCARLESLIPLLRDLTDVAEVCAGASRA